jgi:hypothetical protein
MVIPGDTLFEEMKADREIDALEEELDNIETNSRYLIERLGQAIAKPVQTLSNSGIDHVKLVNSLVSRISEPGHASNPDLSFPRKAVSHFVEKFGSRDLEISNTNLLRGLSIPSFGVGDSMRSKTSDNHLMDDAVAIEQSSRQIQTRQAPVMPLSPMNQVIESVSLPEMIPRNTTADKDRQRRLAKELDELKRLEIERERDFEREGRMSSETLAKDLLRALRSMESQLVQQVRISEEDRRVLERELSRMRGAVEDLELDRQSLLDIVERGKAHEVASKRTISLLKEENTTLSERIESLESESAMRKREAEILKASVHQLETSRAELKRELDSLKDKLADDNRPFFGQQDTVPNTQVSVDPPPTGRIVRTRAPFPDHHGVQALSPSVIEPQRMSLSSLADVERAIVSRDRPHVSLPPFSSHEGFEPKSPVNVVAPHRRSFGDVVGESIRRRVRPQEKRPPPFSDHEKISVDLPILPTAPHRMVPNRPVSPEEKVQAPPTPTTPKPKISVSDSPSPKPRIDVAVVEKELLKLNIERQEIEAWLGRFPPNTAGRTLAERKEKYLKERRLAEVESGISEHRLALKHAKAHRSNPMA